MKYLIPILFVLCLVGCSAKLPGRETAPLAAEENPAWQAPAPGSPWQVVLQTKVQQPMRYAAFLDGSYGLTGGPSETGRAHFTTDGGRTWTMAETSTDCVFNLEIVDAQVAWQCSLGPVRVSNDGARTWTAAADYGNYCRQLSFLDARTGWLAGLNGIGMTEDGGASWQSVKMPAGVQEIAAISLRTAKEGYLLDIRGGLYVTQDSGQSWTKRDLGLEPAGGKLPDPETAAAAVRFQDAAHGLVVVHRIDSAHSQLEALRTADGGQTWSREPVMDTALLTAVYLAHDGATLTVVDSLHAHITVLRYSGGEQ